MINKVERRRALLGQGQREAAAPGESGPHAISDVRAFQVPQSAPGNSYVVLQVRTQSGLVGYGECNQLSSPELKATREVAMGRPASAYETLRPLVPQNSQAAIDMALLDIVGKATKAPVYRVLGGPTRDKARAITRLNGSSDEALESDLEKQLTAGFRAFLIPIPLPTARNQGSEFVRVAAARLKAMRTS